jgi:hypothetical protein
VVGDEEVVEVEVWEHVGVAVVEVVADVAVEVGERVVVLGLRRVEMSEVQSEAVGDGEDVVEERGLRGRGGSIRVVVREIRVGKSARGVQGRCAADGHCRSHNTAAECCVTSGARALDDSAPVEETGRMEGEREAGLTVWGCWLVNGAESPEGKSGWENVTWGDDDASTAFWEGEER